VKGCIAVRSKEKKCANDDGRIMVYENCYILVQININIAKKKTDTVYTAALPGGIGRGSNGFSRISFPNGHLVE
jgi:hypothetical protein